MSNGQVPPRPAPTPAPWPSETVNPLQAADVQPILPGPSIPRWPAVMRALHVAQKQTESKLSDARREYELLLVQVNDAQKKVDVLKEELNALNLAITAPPAPASGRT